MLNYRDIDKFSIHRTALVATYTALIDVILAAICALAKVSIMKEQSNLYTL